MSAVPDMQPISEEEYDEGIQFLFSRKKPKRDHKAVFGWGPFFKYGSNQITGWRCSQEDRVVCIPEFFQKYSFFAVYDGHGGQEVVEYLKEFLHNNILEEMKVTDDVEFSLYAGFLSCDSDLKNITKEELSFITDAVTKELDNGSVDEIKKYLQSNRGSLLNLCAESETLKKLNQENLGDDDDMDDKDYNVDEDNMDVSGSSTATSEECNVTKETGDESDTSVNNKLMNADKPEMKDSDYHQDTTLLPIPEVKAALKTIHTFLNKNSVASNVISSFLIVEEEINQLFSKFEDKQQKISKEKQDQNEESARDNIDSGAIDPCSDDEYEPLEVWPSEEMEICNTEPLVCGFDCGSTATVVLLNKHIVYVANVGDSRCVASVKGRAIDLTMDHIPTEEKEYERINNAGCIITEDGRINGTLNLSRAFGDFRLKMQDTEEPFQAVTVEPSIKSIHINDDLEFIIIASDGIWNAMSSEDVINFISERKTSDPVDICAELFEIIMPLEETQDGTGCDNMSAVIIFLENTGISSYIQRKESVKYNYIIKKDKKFKKTSRSYSASKCSHAPQPNLQSGNDDIQIVDVVLPNETGRRQKDCQLIDLVSDEETDLEKYRCPCCRKYHRTSNILPGLAVDLSQESQNSANFTPNGENDISSGSEAGSRIYSPRSPSIGSEEELHQQNGNTEDDLCSPQSPDEEITIISPESPDPEEDTGLHNLDQGNNSNSTDDDQNTENNNPINQKSPKEGYEDDYNE